MENLLTPFKRQKGFFDYFPVKGRWRSLLIGVISLAVLAGVYFFISRLAGLSEILDTVRRGDFRWLAVSLAGQVAAFLGYAVSFRSVARFDHGPALPISVVIHETFVSLGATRLFAAAGAGGLAVDYWALRRALVSQRKSVVRVIGFNILSFSIFGLGGFLAALLLLVGIGGDAPLALLLTWAVLYPSFFALAFLVTRPWSRPVRRKVRSFVGKALATAIASLEFVGQILRSPGTAPGVFLGGVLFWAGGVAALWGGLMAFGADITIPVLLLAFMTGYLATALPMITGAEGAVDAAMTFTLHWLGLPLHQALLGVLAYRFFSFWIPTVPALLTLLTVPRLARDLRRAALTPRVLARKRTRFFRKPFFR